MSVEIKVPIVDQHAAFGRKLSRLIGKAKYVQKTGKNTFHNYKYATEADFLALVKPLLEEFNLAVVASQENVTREELEPTKGGRRQWLTTVQMNFKLIDGDTGYCETLTSYGTGIDSEDKGLYKAITGCVKYFISKLFLIETGDDPERENENETGDDKPASVKLATPPQTNNKAESLPDSTTSPLIKKAQELALEISGKTGESTSEILKLSSGYEAPKRLDNEGRPRFFFLTPETLKTCASEKWLLMTIANLEKR